MSYATECYDNRNDWIDARRRGIGGSDAPAIMGVTEKGDPASVWVSKVCPEDGDVKAMSERMKWGHRLERPIATGYAEDSGRRVSFPESPYMIRRRTDIPWCSYSPDGWQEADGMDGVGVVQVKNVSAFRREDWIDGPPEEMVVQLQHEMFVEGATWGTLVAMFGGNECAWWDITANPTFQEAMIDMERQFWTSVERRERPTVEPLMRTALKTLKAIYPRSSADVIQLAGDSYLEVVNRAVEIKKEMSELEKQLDYCKAVIQAKLGEAAVGVLDDGRKVTWKTTDRKGYEVKPSSFRVFKFPAE